MVQPRSSAFRLALLLVLAAATSSAQDLKLHVTYVCSGEKIFLDSCNIRDTSDTSTCMVGHPDQVNPNGIMKYTYMTRGDLKKLLPTCQQPSAQQLAAHDAFVKKQQQIIDAQTPKYAPAPPQPTVADVQAELASGGSRDPQELAMRRCIAAGRLPSSCTGNALLSAFSGMISSTLSGLTGQPDANAANAPPDAGPDISGVYQGAGNWRLDFIDGGVLVNCAGLSPNQEAYTLSLANNRATLTIKTIPRPLVLQIHMDGTITGPPGQVTINGVVASGYHSGAAGTGATQQDQYGNLYDAAGNRVPGNANAGYTTFSPRTATCPAINLTSKGAGVGIQTMETNVLKSAFGGDTGPATPPGIRMHGIFAAPTGFSAQFFPESVILGCGPLSARAYPYTVVADGTRSVVTVATPTPLTLSFRADGSLDPGTGPYQVHGRILVGETMSDSYNFLPLETSCNLAVLTPAKALPATGGTQIAAAPR